jgi:hypothetical protein
MSKYLKQVTQEEFEILTRFHPGEVRFYVDTNTDITRRVGTKVRITNEPVKPRKRKSAKRAAAKPKAKPTWWDGVKPAASGLNPKSGRPTNSPVQLGLSSPSFKEGSKAQNFWRLILLQFKKDPTVVVGRTVLVDSVVKTSVYTKNQIGPFVSDCLKAGYLRYREDSAAAS